MHYRQNSADMTRGLVIIDAALFMSKVDLQHEYNQIREVIQVLCQYCTQLRPGDHIVDWDEFREYFNDAYVDAMEMSRINSTFELEPEENPLPISNYESLLEMSEFAVQLLYPDLSSACLYYLDRFRIERIFIYALEPTRITVVFNLLERGYYRETRSVF